MNRQKNIQPVPNRESFSEQADSEVDALKKYIETKESNGDDATVEKIELISKINDIRYFPEERSLFDTWLGKIPKNSFEQPIKINDPAEVTEYLPDVANYTGEPINLFFSYQGGFSNDDLDIIFRHFSSKNQNFEISMTRYQGGLLSVGIGDKTRDMSARMDGKYYGHYHPIGNFILTNQEVLPPRFMQGLLPSPGDIRGFLKNLNSVSDGTRIYSHNGSVSISIHVGREDTDKAVEEYKMAYFDLFLGKNKLGFLFDEDVINYFRERFSIDIQFFPHERTTESSDE